jgi:hypothetical protein
VAKNMPNVHLVKYKSKDGKYVNLGIRLDNGFYVPIKNIVPKHYYLLLDLAEEIVIVYNEKKGGK